MQKQNYRVLTAQERKVLDRVAEGQTNKEIACSLRISPATVKRHLEIILKKLQLRNRVEAAVFSVRMNESPSEIADPTNSSRFFYGPPDG